MKIALDGSLLGARFSGVERAVAQLIAHLPAACGEDDRITVFVGQAFDRFRERFYPDGFDERIEFNQTGLDNTQRVSRIYWQQLVLPRLCHGLGVDVFHAPAYIASAFTAVPTVLSLYDLDALEHPELCRGDNRLHYKLAIPLGARKARRVVVPSDTTRREVARHLPDAYRRTVVVPLGVDQSYAAASDNDAEVIGRYRLPDEYVLWVGNVEPKKNVEVLIRALHSLKAKGDQVPHLVLAGDLSWGTQAVIQQFLASGLQSHVTFLGAVPDADLPAIYRGASVFCFPSLTEGFGLPPLEAMTAGVPVIISDCEALQETSGKAATIVPAHDAEGWAAAIQTLLADTELRQSRIARGRSRAAEYTWQRCAIRTVELYREIVAETVSTFLSASASYRNATD